MTNLWEEAARKGDVDALSAQLKAGASVDALDQHGQTALMITAHKGHLSAVRFLVAAGAKLDVTAKYGLSALMLAIVGMHEDVARTLVAAGANRGLVGTGAPDFAGKSPADLARDRGLEELSRLLDPTGQPPN